jgi:hypothetical protein
MVGEKLLPLVKPFYDRGLCSKAPQQFSGELQEIFFKIRSLKGPRKYSNVSNLHVNYV